MCSKNTYPDAKVLSTIISKYYIVKKFSDGWLMCSQTSPQSTQFIPKSILIELGYEKPDPNLNTDINLEDDLPTNVITVPISKHPRRRSWSKPSFLDEENLKLESPPGLENSKEITIPSLELDSSSLGNDPRQIRSSSCPDRNYMSGLPNYLGLKEEFDQKKDEICDQKKKEYDRIEQAKKQARERSNTIKKKNKNNRKPKNTQS